MLLLTLLALPSLVWHKGPRLWTQITTVPSPSFLSGPGPWTGMRQFQTHQSQISRVWIRGLLDKDTDFPLQIDCLALLAYSLLTFLPLASSQDICPTCQRATKVMESGRTSARRLDLRGKGHTLMPNSQPLTQDLVYNRCTINDHWRNGWLKKWLEPISCQGWN